jgi:hypothetical protein
VTRGFMGPLGGFWPKLGRKCVTGWKQRSCVPPGRVKTNKQTRAQVPKGGWVFRKKVVIDVELLIIVNKTTSIKHFVV